MRARVSFDVLHVRTWGCGGVGGVGGVGGGGGGLRGAGDIRYILL